FVVRNLDPQQAPFAAGVVVLIERFGVGTADKAFVAHALQQDAPPLGVLFLQNLLVRNALWLEGDTAVNWNAGARYSSPQPHLRWLDRCSTQLGLTKDHQVVR